MDNEDQVNLLVLIGRQTIELDRLHQMVQRRDAEIRELSRQLADALQKKGA